MIRVQHEDFDIGAELSGLAAGRTAIGGLCCFVGLVRDLVPRTHLHALTLEHYPGMTERRLGQVEAEAQSRWPLEATLVIHRVGRLQPGDRIVLVAAAAAHRDAAFDACRFIIDTLKSDAPFWKLEETDEGRRWVTPAG